ncbi:hypothetical protein HKBW3C_02353, partial [Candidatus Hakubella thermalkaliphila]
MGGEIDDSTCGKGVILFICLFKLI